ncbi:MAG: anti-sigma factor [Rhodocyclales bacterium]|nr:anti-sigma factor [Rhodocyclales bacterium]
MNAPISEPDLHAYADGRLAGARLTQMETWLAAHPERRAEVDAWRRQSAQLHRAYDAVLNEAIPARLMPPANPPRWLESRSVAAMAWLMLGALIGYLSGTHPTQQDTPHAPAASLPRMAAVAHAVYTPEVRHPVEVGADQEAHLVAWLSKRLGTPLKPPHLDQAGYQLVGGRLLAGDSGEVAQFMYENADKTRLTLYIQPQAAQTTDTSFRYARENGIDVFYWVEDRYGYALSGNTGRDDMLGLATLVYRQIAER